MISRKYQVFISSTFKHMEGARKAAIAGVFDCHHIPIALDDFYLQNVSDVDVIKRAVADCQIHILILGPTYGERPAGETKSYTEIEFDLAERARQHMMIFPLRWEDVLEQRRRLDPDKDREELASTGRLQQFYQKVKSGRYFFREWQWDNPAEIRRYVGLSLAELPHKVDAPRGLVPEPSQELCSLWEFEESPEMRGVASEIDKIYERLRKLVKQGKGDQESIAEAVFLRRRLHELQEKEADAMERRFREGLRFDSDRALRNLEWAESLLGRK